MPRTVRFMCRTDGPFLVSYRFPTLAPMRAVCPKCSGDSPVKPEVAELLQAESKRLGVPMRQLIEEYTRDIK